MWRQRVYCFFLQYKKQYSRRTFGEWGLMYCRKVEFLFVKLAFQLTLYFCTCCVGILTIRNSNVSKYWMSCVKILPCKIPFWLSWSLCLYTCCSVAGSVAPSLPLAFGTSDPSLFLLGCQIFLHPAASTAKLWSHSLYVVNATLSFFGRSQGQVTVICHSLGSVQCWMAFKCSRDQDQLAEETFSLHPLNLAGSGRWAGLQILIMS